MFLACFKVGRYLEPKINLFHTLKLGPQSKESANFFNKVWDQDSRFVPEVSRLIQRQGTCGPSSRRRKKHISVQGIAFPRIALETQAIFLWLVEGKAISEHLFRECTLSRGCLSQRGPEWKLAHAHCVTGYTLPCMSVISAIKSMIIAGEAGANYMCSSCCQ